MSNHDKETASASTACVAVQTWRARIGAAPDFPLHSPTDVECAMEAEITELREVAQRPRTGVRVTDITRVQRELTRHAAGGDVDLAATCVQAQAVIEGLLAGLDAGQLA